MKKIFFSLLLVAFFVSAQVALGDTDFEIIDEVTPVIPTIKGGTSNKPIETDIASFDYSSYLPLEGVITAASISGEWGSTNINKLLKVDLYLNGTLIFDFGEYYSGLSKSEKKDLKKALKTGGTIDFDINLLELGLSDPELEALLEELEGGEATLYLVGKPKFFSSLKLGDITLRIVDPVPNGEDPPPNGNGTPVPEPTTMLLLGAGLIGLWGLRKRIKK